MGGSRIFDWGGLRIDKVRDAGQNVAIFALKSWSIGGGGMALWPPLEPPLSVAPFAVLLCMLRQCANNKDDYYEDYNNKTC